MGVRYNPNDLFDEHGNLRNELERDPFHIPPFNPENFRLYREKIPEDVGSDKRSINLQFGHILITLSGLRGMISAHVEIR